MRSQRGGFRWRRERGRDVRDAGSGAEEGQVAATASMWLKETPPVSDASAMGSSSIPFIARKAASIRGWRGSAHRGPSLRGQAEARLEMTKPVCRRNLRRPGKQP